MIVVDEKQMDEVIASMQAEGAKIAAAALQRVYDAQIAELEARLAAAGERERELQAEVQRLRSGSR